MRERFRFERESAQLGFREFDTPQPADAIDEDAAQPLWVSSVRDKVGALLSASASTSAVKWNAANHPKLSGVDLTALGNRLSRYINRTSVEKAMKTAADNAAVIAEMAHQFQQKIYFDPTGKRHDGKIGEGTLDALGFTRRQSKDLNSVDGSNHRYHAGKDGAGKSAAYKRLENIYRTEKAEFEKFAPGLSPSTWYSFFVNAPFLGRPFHNGIHVELLRRLRRAEKKLLGMQAYAAMSPVELGAALGIDEDHGGGRINSKTSSSMHTFGLATDIGYTKNPWIAGQEGSPTRNRFFREVSINVSKLINGNDHELKPAWLDWLGTDANRSTGSSFDALKKCHNDSLAYLRLETDPAGLEAKITQHNLLKPRETMAAAVKRWTKTIQADRKRLQWAYGSNRKPENGFLNLHRDLVVALRDTGCLAWGAIDLGASQSGDVMHFDCRVSGIGSIVKPDAAHRVTHGHPCRKPAVEKEFREYDVKQPAIPAWEFKLTTLCMPVAIYVSAAAKTAKEVELLIYAHGLNTCSPLQKPCRMPLSFIVDDPFKLGEVIEKSGRPMVLAVPFFDWPNLAPNGLQVSTKWPKHSWHQLGLPKNLNKAVLEILKEVSTKANRAYPGLSRLILAGHSGAYGFLDPVADSHADPEIATGALSKLSHIWGFDTSYTGPGKHWPALLDAKPSLQVAIFYGGDKRPGKGTVENGKLFQAVANKAKYSSRLKAKPISGHCGVPNAELPALLKSLP